jgi:CBS domain-containing protein
VRVEQAMTREVVTVAPSTPLRRVARILTERRIAGLPVVDDDGVFVGLVGERELLEPDRAAAARTAGAAMSSPAACIAPDRPLWEAADLMTRLPVDRLAVAGADGRLVGIVTRADLVRAFARPDAEIELEIRAEHPGLDADVEQGEVTIRGTVVDRRAAAELVRRVERIPGVVAVRSRLLY